MLKYMLDTNICIYLMKEQPLALVNKFSELLSRLEQKPFDFHASGIFGELSQKYPSRKSSFDRMIAAHALALDVTLVTNNETDFSLYSSSGLRIENWTT